MDPIANPLYLTAPFAFSNPEAFAREACKVRTDSFYTRYGNPGTRAVEDQVAAMEGGEAALMLSSGMAALSVLIMTLCGAGSHVVAQRRCYGGTRELLEELGRRFAIDTTFVEQADPNAFLADLTPRTKLVLLESPSNPLLGLTDLGALVPQLNTRGVLCAIDSTIASPVNQQPLAWGVDVVMHSATKYLSGHSDATAGVLVGCEQLVSEFWKTSILLGCQCSPLDAWLVGRGVRTLPMRMDAHNRAGRALAEWLANHADIERVYYPGMAGDRALFEAQMSGGGGVVSFQMRGTVEQADALLGSLREAQLSASFGSFGALVTRPAAMWAGLADTARLQDLDVADTLIRIGVGFEGVTKLIEDLEGAIASIYH